MEEAKEEYTVDVLRKQYEEVKSKIPEEWLEMIQDGGSGENKMEVFLKLNDKEVCLKTCNVKTFYNYFNLSVFKKPKANDFWLRHFDEIQEKDVWKNIRWAFLDTDLEVLDYFIRHNVIFTGMRLCKIGMEPDAVCKVCFKEDEGILHLFLYCEKLKEFFDKTKELVKDLRGNEDVFNWDLYVWYE